MINLAQSASASPLVHAVPTDPGTCWAEETEVAVDAPPDAEVDPAPEAVWPTQAPRTGVYGVVSPRVIIRPDGTYRMYYAQMFPRPGFPAGANDYDNVATRILSAISSDGLSWTPERGVRLTPQEGGAGEYRVVSAEVVPAPGTDGRLRMYYECCNGPQSSQNSIRSALSDDGGTVWKPESGTRFEAKGRNFVSPRIVFLENGSCRIYLSERGRGIISALSEDGGLTFHQEAGIRIALDGPYDSHVAFAPDILRTDGAGYRMYYAGYGAANRADILTAISADGLQWRKAADPVISPGNSRWTAAKCSEMCVYALPCRDGQARRYGIVYEACDGTAIDQRGVWRIANTVTA